MRIYPPVTVEEALEWLKAEARADRRFGSVPNLEAALLPVAQAMAAISGIVLPETVEPFGL